MPAPPLHTNGGLTINSNGTSIFVCALLAFNGVPDESLTSLFRQNPFPQLPRRIVPHVHAVPARKLCHPVSFFILVKAGYEALHAVVSE